MSRQHAPDNAARILRELRAAKPDWNMACSYGAHDWAYNQPAPGYKSCITAGCGSVYLMVDAERKGWPAAAKEATDER